MATLEDNRRRYLADDLIAVVHYADGPESQGLTGASLQGPAYRCHALTLTGAMHLRCHALEMKKSDPRFKTPSEIFHVTHELLCDLFGGGRRRIAESSADRSRPESACGSS